MGISEILSGHLGGLEAVVESIQQHRVFVTYIQVHPHKKDNMKVKIFYFLFQVFRGGPGGFIIAHDNSLRLGSRLYRVGNGGGIIPVLQANRRLRLQWCSTLKFDDPPSKTITALVSFPGSGNTWLRYLIQQATGIYTGSIYIDFGLLKNGFPAEKVTDGSVIVVKTHESSAKGRAPFSKAILLLRSPAAAIQAEFNRQSGGHVGFASPDRYKRHKGERKYSVSKVFIR